MDSIFTERLSQIEKSLEQALPETASEEWRNSSFSSLSSAVTQEHLNGLMVPCRNLLLLGGKRWRPLLLVLCAESVSGALAKAGKITAAEAEKRRKDAYRITPLVEFVHTASLIHDDIEDCSDMRRGKPAAHITWGTDTAINAGSWLYFEAPCCIDTLAVSETDKNRLYRLYTKELRRLHLGQAMDIAWHRNPELIPSIEEYTAMVRCKTGTLASLAAQAGALAGGSTEQQAAEAGKNAADIGVGFQILDDVQNLTTGNPGKKRGDDIVEGKKSLPLLLHLQSHPEDKEKAAALLAAARKEGIDSPAVESCISMLEKSGSIAESSCRGHELVNSRSRELEKTLQTDSSFITKLFESM